MNLLEINDLGLRLFESGRLALESPGFASLEGKTILVGKEAHARSRLDPRRANDRFWYQLDARLPAKLGAAKSCADLAHAHLSSLKDQLSGGPLTVAAPASFTPDQLGILLGLLESVGAKTVGLVDSAVAACSSVPTPSRVIHVDLQLHRIVCTWLAGDEALSRQKVEELKPAFAAMQDRCAGVIAQAFVRNARFDPLHDARTEQKLYDALPGWISRLVHENSLLLELDLGGRSHRVSVDRETLESILEERISALSEALQSQAEAHGAGLVLSDRMAAFPGLVSRLGPVNTLDETAVAQGALLHQAIIECGEAELPWVTRLPRKASTTSDVTPASRATHGLLGSRAIELPDQGQSRALSAYLPGAPGIVREHDGARLIEGLAGSAVRINGQAQSDAHADAKVLRPGDRIVFAGQELRIIEVESTASSGNHRR